MNNEAGEERHVRCSTRIRPIVRSRMEDRVRLSHLGLRRSWFSEDRELVGEW